MADLDIGWAESTPFPEAGWSEARIEARLQERYRELPDPSEVVRLGFAMTEPHPIAGRVWAEFARRNPNNIGTHTRFGEGRVGTRALEKESLAVLAHLYRADATDGYLTQGGTEANLCGLRIGRNALRASGKPRVVVIAGALAHHSIDKAAEILDLPLRRLDVAPSYVTEVPLLERAFVEELEGGASGFVVVSTAGYYNTGLVDPIGKIAAFLDNFQRSHPAAGLYHHVDAAYGGFVLPFTNPEVAFDFRSRKVHSLAVDPHKFGMVPYGCGAVLCRKGLLEHMTIMADRSGVVDETISGSRPGAAAAALWATLHTLGRRGYEALAAACLARKERFLAGISDLDPEARILHRPDMNVFAFSISRKEGRLSQELERDYRLVPNRLPLFRNGVPAGQALFYHCYVMPDATQPKIDAFLGRLRSWFAEGDAQGGDRTKWRLDGVVREIQEGTPCLRHAVVHPAGRRDPSRYPEAYSFHTFVSRRDTGETLRSRTLYVSPALGPVLLYAPDLSTPFSNELGGVSVNGRYNFEVLDSHQAALSLIGSAHLAIHTPARVAQGIANFFDDGRFRSLELKMGDVHTTDELQIFSQQIVFKLGKDARSFYREHDDYSFSIDTSMEIRVLSSDQTSRPEVSVAYNADPFLPRRRHLPRLQLKRFPNRFFGAVLEVRLPLGFAGEWRSSDPGLGVEGYLVGESALRGLAAIAVSVEGGVLSLDVAPLAAPANVYRVRAPLSLGAAIERLLPRLDVRTPQSLDPLEVAKHGERLFCSLEPLVRRVDNNGGIELPGDLLALPPFPERERG